MFFGRSKNNFWRLLIAGFLLLVAPFGVYLLINLLDHNTHVVISNEIYRSAQLNKADIQKYIKDHKIKSVINLRGAHPDKKWYQNEIAVSQASHVVHYDVVVPAKGVPSAKNLAQLVHLIDTAKRPILVHCRAGADRTGLAAAIAVILSGNTNEDALRHQISWRYDAVSPKTVGYQVFKNYQAYLKKTHGFYGRSSFIRWVDSQPKMVQYMGWFFP